MKKNKVKAEKMPKKAKKEKKQKKVRANSNEERVSLEELFQGFGSSGFSKGLIALFVCSLVFTMFSSSILRLTAIPGALKSRAAAIAANANAQNENNNNNSFLENIGQIFEQPTTVDLSATTTTQAPTTQAPTTQAPTTQAPTTKAPATQAPTQKPTEETKPATEPETNNSSASQDTVTTTAPTTTESATDSPETIKEKKAVLNTFKKVVNSANTTKPGFTKVQYRTMDKDDGAKIILRDVEKNYPGYFISQEEAEAAPYVAAKFSDMSLFCIENENFACLLSDKFASEAIKSVEKVSQSDGSVKITIVLRDEENPAVTPVGENTPLSHTSAMFPVLDKEEVKTKLVARQGLLISIDDVNLNYHDCTMELVYMPKTGRIVSLTQTAVYDCNVSFTAAMLFADNSACGVVTDTAVYTDFVY